MSQDGDLAARLGASAALHVAKGIGYASRAWGQKGLGTIFKLVGRVPTLNRLRCRVEFAPGSFFETEVFEPYWAPTIVGRRPYEPELAAVLHALAGVDATFVDCGANFGYWSIIATGATVGFTRAVAIEPNPPTFARLLANAAANGDRFTCVQAAVSDKAGERLTLADAQHHAVAYLSDTGGPGIEVVTTTIDGALEERGWVDERPVVVKVDVEGHELQAIAGGRRMRERTDHAFIYEDFARTNFPTSRGLLEQGYRLGYVTKDGRCHRIADATEARRWVAADDKLKGPRNLVATRPGGALDARIDAWARSTGG